MSTPDQTKPVPTKLADIKEPVSTDRCSKCGHPATFKLNLFVKPNSRAGKAIVRRTYATCERCAAFIVNSVQNVFDA